MYIYTAYIQASVLTRVRGWGSGFDSVPALKHIICRDVLVCLFSQFHLDSEDMLTSFRSPRSGDPRADIWPVSQEGETNLRQRFFFYFVRQLLGFFFFFCKVGWRGFDKRLKKRKLIMGCVMQREVRSICKLTKVALEWMLHISEDVW